MSNSLIRIKFNKTYLPSQTYTQVNILCKHSQTDQPVKQVKCSELSEVECTCNNLEHSIRYGVSLVTIKDGNTKNATLPLRYIYTSKSNALDLYY